MPNGNPAPGPLNSRYFRPVRGKETRARRWDLQFESTSLQQPVCLSGEPRGCQRKAPHFGGGLRREWNDGRLVGLPYLEEFYRSELDRERWGLLPVAQVDSYKGLLLATWCPSGLIASRSTPGLTARFQIIVSS